MMVQCLARPIGVSKKKDHDECPNDPEAEAMRKIHSGT